MRNTSYRYWMIYVIAIVAAMGGLLFGFDTGVISGAIPFFQKDFGIDDSMVEMVTSSGLLGAILGALCCGKLTDRIGRRKVILTSAVILATGALWSGWASGVYHLIAAQLGDSGKWLSIVLIFLYVGFFAISIGPLGWLIVSEVFPQKLRGLGASLGSLSVWFFNAIVSFTFFKILKVFSIPGVELTINGESQGNPAGAFLFYAFIGILAIIWGYFYVPETKGVSLEKIEAFWRKGGHPKDKII